MAENEKNKINELESSADSLLARLSGQFEPSTKENPVVEKQENGAEMNTAEFEVNDVLPSEDESVVLAEEASLNAGNESTPSQLELFDVPAVEERPAEKNSTRAWAAFRKKNMTSYLKNTLAATTRAAARTLNRYTNL